jgi:DNA-binding NtrC family response regulator
MENPVILIVNANRSELETLSKQIADEGYTSAPVSSPEEINSAVAGKKNIKLALLDLTGFDESIWEHCDRMHQAKIPFIVIAPQRSPGIQRDSMKHGASGLLVKPLGIKDLMEHIQTAIDD